MLRAVHSSRAEHLLAALIERLPPADPFAPSTIVVGHRLVSRWIRRELALARGIAAGLDVVSFEHFVERAWADPREGVRALDRERLAAALASALADEEVVARLPAVASYLAAAPAPGDRAGPRRVQLATHLAQLAWQYALTRPDWMPALLGGRVPSELAGDPGAAWQASLLAAAVARLGGGTWTPVPCLPWARQRAGLKPPALAPVAVMGIGALARAQLEALSDLARATDVTVYVLDPCRELWDDVSGRAGAMTSEPRTPDPLLLSLWGKPVRDTLAALVERSGGDVDDRFDAEPGEPTAAASGELAGDATALGALLADVRDRRPPPAAGDPQREAGVAVLACPNVRREVEVVADEIRARLDADPTLRAHEIGVWIAAAGGGAERYLAQAPAAFDAVGVPCHLIDAPIDDRGRVAEAVLAMLELPTSAMRRRDLLRVMTHPAVLAGHPHVDASRWVRWTEQLGIAHGASAASHGGTYLEEFPGRFHWDQGIRRLALGAFMTDDRGPVRLGDQDVAPEEIEPDDHASAATFALLARSLLADAEWLAHHQAPLADWASIFAGLVEAYLAAATDDGRRELDRVRGMLAGIARLDVDGRALGFREARAHASARLSGERADRGEPLSAGVMLAPLRALRALPFRHVFVVGLDEGAFPSGDQPSPLDLRKVVRAGDVSPRDRDRHAFLEVLLGARDSLTLSYVAIEGKSGSALGPSSVVLELADALAPYVGAVSSREALTRITRRYPLHRHAESGDGADAGTRTGAGTATPQVRPAVARERWAVGVRDAVRAHLVAAGHPVPDEDELLALLGEPTLERLRAALALAAAPTASERAAAARPISLANLRGFLEHPVQAWAQVVLGLHELPEGDTADHSDEPFQVDRPARAGLLREVLATWLAGGGELEAEYSAIARDRELRGQFPVGVFGEAARAVDLALVRRWRTELDQRGATASRRIAFGRAHARGAELRPALELDLGGGRTIQLVGQTELIVSLGGSGAGGALGRATSIVPMLRDAKPGAKEHLRGALDHAVLAAAGLAPQGHAHILLGADGSARSCEHAPWPPAEARAYLAGLARELLDGAHGYLLPFDALAQPLRGKEATVSDHDPTSGLGYGPITRRDGLAPPDGIAELTARRLAPLFERMTGDHNFAAKTRGSSGGAAPGQTTQRTQTTQTPKTTETATAAKLTTAKPAKPAKPTTATQTPKTTQTATAAKLTTAKPAKPTTATGLTAPTSPARAATPAAAAAPKLTLVPPPPADGERP